MRRLPLYIAMGLVVSAAGCKIEKFTADTTSKMLIEGSAAMDREADVEFARSAFPASLKTLETFLVNSPNNESLLLLLARGYNSYAFGILEGDLERAVIEGPATAVEKLTRRAKMHYLRGSEYGFRLLGDPALQRAAQEGDIEALDARLAQLDEEDIAGLFWAGYGWASAINLAKDDADLLSDLPAVERIMQRAYELGPGYNAGAPIMFFGVYHASRPVMFGGKPDVSKRYFEEAMAKHGDENLLVPFLYARYYAVQVQDRKLFDSLMDRVGQADVTAHPDMRLTNEIARERAAFWIEHVDEILAE